MNDEMKCLRCGGSNLALSDIQSTGKVYSRPKDASLRLFLATGFPVNGLMCPDCGHLELVVDVKKASPVETG
jgi:predicted nucleic-acid-binding Zn-ribbon protein